jgi:hypothetical protein
MNDGWVSQQHLKAQVTQATMRYFELGSILKNWHFQPNLDKNLHIAPYLLLPNCFISSLWVQWMLVGCPKKSIWRPKRHRPWDMFWARMHYIFGTFNQTSTRTCTPQNPEHLIFVAAKLFHVLPMGPMNGGWVSQKHLKAQETQAMRYFELWSIKNWPFSTQPLHSETRTPYLLLPASIWRLKKPKPWGIKLWHFQPNLDKDLHCLKHNTLFVAVKLFHIIPNWWCGHFYTLWDVFKFKLFYTHHRSDEQPCWNEQPAFGSPSLS